MWVIFIRIFSSVHPIMTGDMLHHGGDPDAVKKKFGWTGADWLDLSTGINPMAWSVPEISPSVWRSLPSQQAVESVKRVAAEYYGVKDPNCILPAPGTQSLLQMLPRLRPPGNVAVLSPTYGEHAHCWTTAGHRVHPVSSLEAAWSRNPDVIVAVHPNNPDGQVLDREEALAAADRLAGKNGWLLLDEAFADTMPEQSLASHVGQKGLVILRSFGKFFGLAGLRLGFLLGSPPFVSEGKRALGPWAVSGPALYLGTLALRDRDWIRATRRQLMEGEAQLKILLEAGGLPVRGGTPLFQLVDSTQAPNLFQHLGRHGIYVRHFPEQPCWLRFGLPGSELEWTKLKTIVSKFSSTVNMV